MGITEDLQAILDARYGRDVRQAIHDSIEEGYNIAVQAQGAAETSQDSAEAYAAAALASEQNAQDYMELAEQYKNEAFSGTPTGYSDLVARVNSIYKETASSFSLVDTVEGLALAHTIYGMSVQDGTPTPSVPVDIDSAVANFTCTDSDSTNTTTITTDLTLRAIEVTSSDDYNLVKDGKYYVADTLDWDEDSGYSITRRIKEITINSGDVTTTTNPRYGVVLRTAFNPNEFSVRQSVKNNLLLSAFVSANYENFISESGNGLAFFDGTNLRLRHDSMTSTADWSTYLQSNPVKVTGILINPTTESITSAQAQALLGLKTYDEATSIDATGDVAPSVTLEYSKDRTTALGLMSHNLAHINSLKIADLS